MHEVKTVYLRTRAMNLRRTGRGKLWRILGGRTRTWIRAGLNMVLGSSQVLFYSAGHGRVFGKDEIFSMTSSLQDRGKLFSRYID